MKRQNILLVLYLLCLLVIAGVSCARAQHSPGAESEPYSEAWIHYQIDSIARPHIARREYAEGMEVLIALLKAESRFAQHRAARLNLHNVMKATYARMFAFRNAISEAWKAYSLVPDSDVVTRHNLIVNVASNYTRLGEQDSAIISFRRGLAYIQQKHQPEKQGGDYRLFVASAMNNLGIGFFKGGRLDSAETWYREAHRRITAFGESGRQLKVSILDNLAQLEGAKDRPAEGLRYYDEILRMMPDLPAMRHPLGQRRWINTVIGKARLNLDLGRLAEAGRLVRAIVDSMAVAQPSTKEALHEAQLQLQVRFHAATSDFAAANRINMELLALSEAELKQLQEEQAAVVRAMTSAQVTQLTLKRNAERALAEVRIQAIKAASRVRVLLMLLAALALAVVIAVMWFRLRRRRRRLEVQATLHTLETRLLESELEREEIDKEKAEIELQRRNEDIQTLATDVVKKKAWGNELLTFVNSLRSMEEVERLLSISDIEAEILRQLHVEAEVSLEALGIEEINASFYAQLKEKYPKLTQADRDLCGLLRLGLSNAEIADLRNISLASARTARYRLKKKLALAPDEDLAALLEAMH